MSRRGLVIFDCDGVLVDSEPIATRVLTDVLAETGWPLPEAEVIDRFRGGTLAAIVTALEEHLGRPVADGWLDDFTRRRDDALRADLQPVPGAAEAVRGVRDLGFDACVASQGRLEKSRLTLGLTGLDTLFAPDRVFSAYDDAHPKPAPDLFLRAAQVCGHTPDGTVVVEDSPTGVAAAHAAGMRVLVYAADPATPAVEYGERFADMHAVPRLIA